MTNFGEDHSHDVNERDIVWGLAGIATCFLLVFPCWLNFLNRFKCFQDDEVMNPRVNKVGSGTVRNGFGVGIDYENRDDRKSSDGATGGFSEEDVSLIVVREVLLRKRQEAMDIEANRLQEAMDIEANRLVHNESSRVDQGVKNMNDDTETCFVSVESYSSILDDLNDLQNDIGAEGVLQQTDINWLCGRARNLGIDLDVSSSNVTVEAGNGSCSQNIFDQLQTNRNIKDYSCVNEIMYYSYLVIGQKRLQLKMLTTRIISSLSLGVCDIATLSMIAHSLGVYDVIAFGLTFALIRFNECVIQGFSTAAGVQAKRALSQMRPAIAGQFIQLSVLTSLGYIIPVYIIWCFFAKDFLVLIGVSSQSASLSKELSQALFISVIVRTIHKPIRELLEADGYFLFVSGLEKIRAFWLTVSTFIAIILFDNDVPAIGWALSITDGCMLVLLLFNSYFTGSYFLSTYKEGLLRQWSFAVSDFDSLTVINFLQCCSNSFL